MQVKPINITKSSPTVSYLILSALSIIIFTLAFQDLNMLVFAIPILLIFILAASQDRKSGTPDEDLRGVSWTDKNIELAVPLGIIGGLASLFFGGLIMQITPENSAMIVGALIPDFNSALRLATVIPPAYALGANIIAQWMVIAPSEESISKVLAPFAFMSIFKNLGIAYIAGSLLWEGSHVPTFIIQDVPNAMYLVLTVLATITLIVYFLTKSVLATAISHGVYNSGVLLMASMVTPIGIYVIGSIGALLAYIWLKGKK